MKSVHLARGVHLPIDAVTQGFAIIGKRGSGKTYAAGVLVEGMLDVGGQVVVFDPIGNWWALRVAADGKGPGYSIPVFGGEHGDLPIEPESGALIADLIVREKLSAVVDVSGFRKAQRKRFVADFAEELYHRKKRQRSPLHLVLEEAQLYAPQRLIGGGKNDEGGDARMKGAIEDLCRLGRNYGIGFSLLTQRPQSVDKDVLNMSEALLVFQVVGPHERKAIREWVVDHGLDRKLTDELPELEIGHCYLWSPQWLRTLERIRVRKKRTFDASSTPTAGKRGRAEPRKLRPVEIKRLGERMAAVVERAKESDPKALRAELANARARLAVLERGKGKAAAAPKPVDVGPWRREIARLESEARVRRDRMLSAIERAGKALDALRASVGEPIFARSVEAPGSAAHPDPRANGGTPPGSVHKGAQAAPAAASGGQRILNQLAELADVGLSLVSKAQVAAFCGYSNHRSGGFSEPLSVLRDDGLVTYPRPGWVQLTAAGEARAERRAGALVNSSDLQERLARKLGGAEERVFRALLARYPDATAKGDLAAALGYTNARSGGFSEPVARLKALGIVEYPERGTLRVAEWVWLQGDRA